MEDLLNKYWQGNASKEELAMLYRLVCDSDESLKHQLEQEFNNEINKKELSDIDFDAILQRLKQEVLKEHHETHLIVAEKKHVFINYLMVAASVLLIFIAGSYYLNNTHSGEDIDQEVAIQQIPEWMNIGVENDTSFLLKDGSAITLYAGASIRYDTAYNILNRKVYLDQGTLTVSVVKNKTLPFSVVTDNTETIAIGTVFTVSNKKNKPLYVHLFEGRVNVKQVLKDASVLSHTLSPGDQLWLTDSSERKINSAVVKKKSPSVKTPVYNDKPLNKLRFEQSNLEEIIKILEERFEVNINSSEHIMRETWFSGEFGQGERVEDILKMICLINELELLQVSEKEFEIRKINP